MYATGGGDRTLLALMPSSSYGPTRHQVWILKHLADCFTAVLPQLQQGVQRRKREGPEKRQLTEWVCACSFSLGEAAKTTTCNK